MPQQLLTFSRPLPLVPCRLYRPNTESDPPFAHQLAEPAMFSYVAHTRPLVSCVQLYQFLASAYRSEAQAVSVPSVVAATGSFVCTCTTGNAPATMTSLCWARPIGDGSRNDFRPIITACDCPAALHGRKAPCPRVPDNLGAPRHIGGILNPHKRDAPTSGRKHSWKFPGLCHRF